MICFYPLNSLASPDAVFYCYTFQEPKLNLHVIKDRLILSFSGSTDEKLKLLSRLSNLGVFDFYAGSRYSPEVEDLSVYWMRFIEFFEGKKILDLVDDCSDWAGLNLEALFPECLTFNYDDASSADPFKPYLSSFPEFVLDTGEFLEEDFTSQVIGSVGVLKNTDHMSYTSFEYLMGGLLCYFRYIERLMVLHDIMQSDAVEDKFKELLGYTMAGGLQRYVKSWEYLGCKPLGRDKFIGKLKDLKDRSKIISSMSSPGYLYQKFNPRILMLMGYIKVIRVKFIKLEGFTYDLLQMYLWGFPLKSTLLPTSGSEVWDKYALVVMDPAFEVVSEDELSCTVDIPVYMRTMD